MGMAGAVTGQCLTVTTLAGSDRQLVREVLDGRLVRPVFQPIVDLERETTVGYEALARVQVGSLTSPAALFQAGRAAGQLAELDWLCRERAVDAARDGGLRYPLSLFINAEPETLLADDGDAQRWGQFGDLRCYTELTERALAAHPAALLRAIDQVREQDWGIALDDVGADPQSLALLPMIRPDVIKLDLALLQRRPTDARDVTVARVLHSALSQAADTGAVVIAEGIETEQHLDLARAYGAQYGQGYLLGRPGPLPTVLTSPTHPVPLLLRSLDRSLPPGPFAVVAGAAGVRRADHVSVRELARQLLAQARELDPAPVVLVCANDPDLLPSELCSLLEALGDAPVVGLVGSSPVLAQLSGLRCHLLQPGDPAGHDFAVVVVGGYYTAALVSRPTLQATPTGVLDMALTFDTDLASSAAQALLARLP